MERVERLTSAQALAARPLWSEIFFEDTDRFTDYYFAEKMPGNVGYGVKCGSALRAMLFLTPYTARIKAPDRMGNDFQDVPVCYIVGVGTQRQYRHRGYMDRLIRRALADLYGQGQPFTFLMPADPAIYAPYQFRYIYDRPHFCVHGAGDVAVKPLEKGQEERLAAFAEAELEKKYQVFIKRDASYFRRQKKESLAQNGDVYLWTVDGQLAGYYLYAQEEGTEEIQEALTSDAFESRIPLEVTGDPKPAIMARIADVRAMLSLMRLSPGAPKSYVRVPLKVRDALLAGNNATFLWTVGKKESTIALLEPGDILAAQVDIEDLTAFLFGRKRAGECFAYHPLRQDGGTALLRAASMRERQPDPSSSQGESAPSSMLWSNILQSLELIQPLSGTFLNEIV